MSAACVFAPFAPPFASPDDFKSVAALAFCAICAICATLRIHAHARTNKPMHDDSRAHMYGNYTQMTKMTQKRCPVMVSGLHHLFFMTQMTQMEVVGDE